MTTIVHADAAWLGGSELARAVTLRVDGETVRRVAPSADAIHLDGVLVPGLMDHHVHTELIDLPALLRSGITAVRDLGAPCTVFSLCDSTIPRVLAVGPFLTTRGGYPFGRDWLSPGMAIEVDIANASAVVSELAERAAVGIKIALNADAGPVLDDATIAIIVHEARLRRLPVIAHVEGEGQCERAVRHGVDELAHAPWTQRLSDQLIRTMAARMRWVSTVDIHTGVQRGHVLDNLRRFRGAGGIVSYGTDLGNGTLPMGVNSAELDALVEAGVPVLAAIATDERALSMVAGDPLADPSVLLSAQPLSALC